MSRTITPTKDLSKKATEEKLRAEISALEKLVGSPVWGSPEYSALVQKWNRLQPTSRVSRKRFSDRINREDSTLRSQYGAQAFEPVEGFLDTDLTDALALGYFVAVLGETPENPGPRFHTPVWVKDLNLFRKFGSRLANARKKQYPALKEFQQSKSDVDCAILFDYFVDHLSYEGVFSKYSRAANEAEEAYGVYDVGAKEANSVEEAVEFAAQKNGTFSCPDEDDGFTFFDQVKDQWRKVTARRINDKLFRVDFREQNDDKYFLPEKLDPSKKESTRHLQRYIQDLVDQGYALLKIAKPKDADRKITREFREDEKERVIARAQLGTGTNPKHFENNTPRREMSQDMQLKMEYGRLFAKEAAKRTKDEDKATEGLNSYQLWLREKQRGEAAFRKLMDETKAAETVARFSHPWQPPVEPEPAVTPPLPQTGQPAVRHEILRLSIQLFLAALAQGPWHVAA